MSIACGAGGVCPMARRTIIGRRSNQINEAWVTKLAIETCMRARSTTEHTKGRLRLTFRHGPFMPEATARERVRADRPSEGAWLCVSKRGWATLGLYQSIWKTGPGATP